MSQPASSAALPAKMDMALDEVIKQNRRTPKKGGKKMDVEGDKRQSRAQRFGLKATPKTGGGKDKAAMDIDAALSKATKGSGKQKKAIAKRGKVAPPASLKNAMKNLKITVKNERALPSTPRLQQRHAAKGPLLSKHRRSESAALKARSAALQQDLVMTITNEKAIKQQTAPMSRTMASIQQTLRQNAPQSPMRLNSNSSASASEGLSGRFQQLRQGKGVSPHSAVHRAVQSQPIRKL